MNFKNADDVKNLIAFVVKNASLSHIRLDRLVAIRSTGTKTRAVARIWGLSNLWQEVLKVKPAYIIEVISEKYDRLDEREKRDVIIHELSHIPKNFSGSLVPHFRKGPRRFSQKIKNIKDSLIAENKLS